MNLYTDIDPFVCRWLEYLIETGCLPKGEVWCCDVKDIDPSSLSKFRQCHFFCGIGGWPLACLIAGYGHKNLWTGSCPCQPFSKAGLKKTHEDSRNCYSDFHRLIAFCKPPVVFGEQVASVDGVEWLDGVFYQLENAHYACGSAELCAPGVSAPQNRPRLYWVGDSGSDGLQENLLPVDDVSVEINVLQSRWSVLFDHWSQFDAVSRDGGLSSRCEPGTFPLDYGVSKRVGEFRGYGNAIIPQVAATFMQAFYQLKS